MHVLDLSASPQIKKAVGGGVCLPRSLGHRPEMKAEIHFPVGHKKVRDGGDGGDHRLQCDKKN